MYACVRVCLCVCMCMCVYMYVHTCVLYWCVNLKILVFIISIFHLRKFYFFNPLNLGFVAAIIATFIKTGLNNDFFFSSAECFWSNLFKLASIFYITIFLLRMGELVALKIL